jgi:hypothetical protein
MTPADGVTEKVMGAAVGALGESAENTVPADKRPRKTALKIETGKLLVKT